MAILIQNKKTKQYLSACGLWVDAIAEAKDFVAILPAYKFAKEFTSGLFEVMLHFAEDTSLAPIIGGLGEAPVPESDASEAIEATATLLWSTTEPARYREILSLQRRGVEILEAA